MPTVKRGGVPARPPSDKQRRYLDDLYARLRKPAREPETMRGASAAIQAAKAQLATRARYSPRPEPPTTPGQLHDLAVLARRAGETPPRPSSTGDAAREIARPRSASPSMSQESS